MNRALVEKVANALLYEGYLLYPYRADSVKNRQRWTFGGVAPGGDTQTECLLRGEEARLEVCARFLHLVSREGPGGAWQEAIPREVVVPPLAIAELPRAVPFAFEGGVDGARRWSDLAGVVELEATPVGGVRRVTVRVRNRTAHAGEHLLGTFASTHVILRAEGGAFVSLLDPPDELRAAAEGCENVGTWPVLVGEPGSTDAMLSSPIIVYDHPAVAPESPGDLFDATEIDEILTLRILTLTDGEKDAMRAVDARARALLERTEALSAEHLLAMHGRLTNPLRKGARVRLRPRRRADIFDLALDGRTATIASIERDLEGRIHVAVTVDDDPGRDLGAQAQVGHRFFFGLDEVEPLGEAA